MQRSRMFSAASFNQRSTHTRGTIDSHLKKLTPSDAIVSQKELIEKPFQLIPSLVSSSFV